MIYLLETIEFRKGIVFLRLSGVVEKDKSKELLYYLKNLVEEKGVRYIALNLELVPFIDTIGIRLIDDIDQCIRKNNGIFVLCGSNNKVEKKCKTIKNLLFTSTELNVFSMIKI